ncbi:hypothetical protein V8F20_004794 [Naviculisporaceae sp. PSN 640]
MHVRQYSPYQATEAEMALGKNILRKAPVLTTPPRSPGGSRHNSALPSSVYQPSHVGPYSICTQPSPAPRLFIITILDIHHDSIIYSSPSFFTMGSPSSFTKGSPYSFTMDERIQWFYDDNNAKYYCCRCVFQTSWNSESPPARCGLRYSKAKKHRDIVCGCETCSHPHNPFWCQDCNIIVEWQTAELAKQVLFRHRSPVSRVVPCLRCVNRGLWNCNGEIKRVCDNCIQAGENRCVSGPRTGLEKYETFGSLLRNTDNYNPEDPRKLSYLGCVPGNYQNWEKSIKAWRYGGFGTKAFRLALAPSTTPAANSGLQPLPVDNTNPSVVPSKQPEVYPGLQAVDPSPQPVCSYPQAVDSNAPLVHPQTSGYHNKLPFEVPSKSQDVREEQRVVCPPPPGKIDPGPCLNDPPGPDPPQDAEILHLSRELPPMLGIKSPPVSCRLPDIKSLGLSLPPGPKPQPAQYPPPCLNSRSGHYSFQDLSPPLGQWGRDNPLKRKQREGENRKINNFKRARN